MTRSDTLRPDTLRSEIADVLARQGYAVDSGHFRLNLMTENGQPDNALRDALRQTHKLAKTERLLTQGAYIRRHADWIKERMVNGGEISVEKINPKLKRVTVNSDYEMMFRWWNYVWWSLPYERAYGRQMRYVVWDEYHQAPIGLIGLQSPILSWAPRDKYLNMEKVNSDLWINQSMNAQRIGALPPYNDILGGKLVAMLMTSDRLRRDFREKYRDRITIMKGRNIPARLLFITTTGAFGKSSIYTRLAFNGEHLAKFIGYTQGCGTFHIPNSIYEKLMGYLTERGFPVKRSYGNGPSQKMRLIQKSMSLLGYRNGNAHGIKRGIYYFPFARNVHELISGRHQRPLWHHRSVSGLADYWKERWILPRFETRKQKKKVDDFDKNNFVNQQLAESLNP